MDAKAATFYEKTCALCIKRPDSATKASRSGRIIRADGASGAAISFYVAQYACRFGLSTDPSGLTAIVPLANQRHG